MSRDALLDSIKEGLKAGAPDGAPALNEASLDEIAGNIGDGKRPQGPPPPRHAARGAVNLIARRCTSTP